MRFEKFLSAPPDRTPSARIARRVSKRRSSTAINTTIVRALVTPVHSRTATPKPQTRNCRASLRKQTPAVDRSRVTSHGARPKAFCHRPTTSIARCRRRIANRWRWRWKRNDYNIKVFFFFLFLFRRPSARITRRTQCNNNVRAHGARCRTLRRTYWTRRMRRELHFNIGNDFVHLPILKSHRETMGTRGGTGGARDMCATRPFSRGWSECEAKIKKFDKITHAHQKDWRYNFPHSNLTAKVMRDEKKIYISRSAANRWTIFWVLENACTFGTRSRGRGGSGYNSPPPLHKSFSWFK